MSKAEKLQLKKRQKLEKLLKRGKRLGQRMRRQLYEKLYGSNAKHLQVTVIAAYHTTYTAVRSTCDSTAMFAAVLDVWNRTPSPLLSAGW